jgi:hypothetical protein
MNEDDLSLAIPGNGRYVIPARLVKQLVEAAEPAPEPSAMELLVQFLKAAGIEYSWEIHHFKDSDVAEVWFHPPYGWELVMQFDGRTGEYTSMSLEA